jgi:hypothetical protein
MKHLIRFVLACLLVSGHDLSAQPYRYLEPVFDEVDVITDIPYAVNATILFAPITGEAVPEQLSLDLYAPAGDTHEHRPLIIYFHSGNFLPHPQNQSPQGTRSDSSTVAMCRYLASTGYVVASADYRLGWNPIADNQFARIFGIINAAYRGVQDANTCIRFFKKSVAEDGNPFRIDTSKIVLWGEDTGGYLATHASALDRWEKITWNPQFMVAPGLYMIMEYLNGDPEGKTYGINDPPSPLLPFPVGDTLNYPNHTEYSSRFCVAVSIAGAVADTTWIETGRPPIIAVQAPYDDTSPDSCDLVVLRGPQGEIPIIFVCGSYAIATRQSDLGIAQDLEPLNYLIPFQQTMTEVAMARTGGLAGLLPIYGDTLSDSAPWEFWSPDNPNHARGLMFNPRMSKDKATRYQDSIRAYVLPRLYPYCVVSTESVLSAGDIGLTIYPNPARERVHVLVDASYTLKNLRLYDLQGRLVRSDNSGATSLPTYALPSGLYVLTAGFNQGMASRMIRIE